MSFRSVQDATFTSTRGISFSPESSWDDAVVVTISDASFFQEKCGEVEDVVGALTPVVGGVAQVFHDLLVELRLLLVAEVEEREEEDRQEEGEEVKGGSQVEETTTTWMAMMMTVSGVRARLELEPNVSVMKCARNRTTCARSVAQCYASGEVLCGIVVSVFISLCVIELSVPVFHIVVLILHVVIL